MSHTGEDKGDMTTKCRVVFLNRKRTRMKKTDKKNRLRESSLPGRSPDFRISFQSETDLRMIFVSH